MLIVIIILTIILLIVSFLYYLKCKEIKQLAVFLEKINDEKRIELARVNYPTRNNQKLVEEINRLLSQKENDLVDFRKEKMAIYEMISNISHDMRTPLTAVLGYISLIEDDNVPKKEKEKYLKIVSNRAKLLQNLLLDFYDLSRLDEDSYTIQKENININEECLEIIANTYDTFEKNDIEVNVDLCDNAPLINIDVFALRRIIENLFQNVIKHKGKSLYITSKVKKDTYILSVANDSKELKNIEIEKVFDRTYTGVKSRTNKNTGLGLSICKSLMEKMNYQIEAKSKDDKFIIELIFKMED